MVSLHFGIFVGVMAIACALLVIFERLYLKGGVRTDLSVYERKPYLFDATSELRLFKLLNELFGDRFYIFTQVNYSHLIRPKKTDWIGERRLRSRIDRKSADFVLCDKERVVPQLVIELDGYVHNFETRRRRDRFIDELTKEIGLPILHLTPDKMDRSYVLSEVIKMVGM
ncbi:MAG: hypothetical protein RLZZ347_414 [Candidatus Parcubacteria bacterium]|jgi:hypothetical protein